MCILLTNDDGILAPGLAVLEAIARQLTDDVWIVAPETDQSGKGHSLSLHDPLRLREIDPKRFAVSGTPTDCVIMALRHILPEPPDLILSGVNRGANIADDVTYSGTVAAAMEGTLLGVTSIALSQAYAPEGPRVPDWQAAEAHGADIVRKILAAGVPQGILMNVNFPARPAAEVSGIEVTSQFTKVENFISVEGRVDLRDTPYYWIRYRRQWTNPAGHSDMAALSRGAISITPLRLDLTDAAAAENLRKAFG